MKIKIFSFVFAGIIFFVSCKQQSENSADPNSIPTSVINNPQSVLLSEDNDDLPKMTFTETSHDFGIIKQGDVMEYSFRFRNTGKSDLIISNATASCGCTVPYYPKNPIKPGEEENIKITFNSSGKKGIFTKEINVTANTFPNENKLSIKGEITETAGEKK